MKIKEVEERVGLTRSNIRFYEKEGLLLIDRDQENNYRDYTEADVERINKNKTLRIASLCRPLVLQAFEESYFY